MRYYVDALLLLRSIMAINLALPFWKNASLHASPSSLRELSLFGACPSNELCPSALCAYAANVVGKCLDTFFNYKRFSRLHLYSSS
jgi:hypothetical protein